MIRLTPLKLTPSRIAVSAALLSLIITSSDVWSISTSIVPTITALPFSGFKSPIAESLNAYSVCQCLWDYEPVTLEEILEKGDAKKEIR